MSWYTKAGADAAWAAAGHTHTFDIPRADGPCFDNTNRYVDCRNGTVTDTVTGLIWLQQLNCLPVDTWAGANQAAAGLENGDCGLTDNSSAGDWRLPTEDEWSATIARAVALGCVAGGSPVLTNDAGTSCYGTGAGSSFVGVVPGGPLSSVWWSRSTNEANPAAAWFAHLSNGGLLDYDKDGASLRVWPVRGGSR